MEGLITFVVGVAVGILGYSITMKVSFKQRTIDYKIRVYDVLIGKWVQMRNHIYAHHPGNSSDNVSSQVIYQFDQMYGESQQLIGEAILVCEDAVLTNDINELNERMYRTKWHNLPLEQLNEAMESIKKDAISIVSRMREDIKESTRLELRDFAHIASGFWHKRHDS
ncbi:MAG TPA: hypothetical protein VGA95_02270 [Thermodesulfobacteriota bacterium]